MSTTANPTTKLDLPTLAARLQALHVPGQPLILTNVHDAGTAQQVASLPSTRALATASYAVAASQGIADDDMTLAQNLAGIANVVAGLERSGRRGEVPLTADLQDGYEDPAESVRRAIALGVVGANVEDIDCKGPRDGEGRARLRDLPEQVARLKAVVAAAKEAGVEGFVVNARTDVLGYGGTMADVVQRGKAFLEAGAACVFVWGVGKYEIQEDEVKGLVAELGGRVSIQPGVLGMAVAKRTGVARISTGPLLWRMGLERAKEEAVKLLEA